MSKEIACAICMPEFWCIDCIETSKGRYKIDETVQLNSFIFINHPIAECPILREDKVINTEDGKQ